MTDIRLLFNKSCAKTPKRRKINNDEEACKLPSKTDTDNGDEQHEAPGLVERECGETLQSETVEVRLDVAAQVGLPPTMDTDSESQSETDGYGSEPEEQDNQGIGKGDDHYLVPVDDERSGSEPSRDGNEDGDNDNASASVSVSAPGNPAVVFPHALYIEPHCGSDWSHKLLFFLLLTVNTGLLALAFD